MSDVKITKKEVYFDQYCKTCKFKDKDEQQDPCDECLNEYFNEGSHKPVKYKEADK